ncbi:uncharacterized protein LOC129913200, partial [Episyrphus balteatus]|uniref:uncharacterized protein LOC129913200 n=1 Tax=Episyrphus balteatus TaxID=286459 RepID=UPI002485312E
FIFHLGTSSSTYFSFVTGFRGSRKLKVGEYSFTRNKSSGPKTYWSCARAGIHKCKARVVTIDEETRHDVIIKCGFHNHAPF